ncbi:MAG: 3'-5' exonuclease, partial [Alphaproteobacteria bacterium]|nr:3'-5' exonuclease [Alphaproteobacteria bacterium]
MPSLATMPLDQLPILSLDLETTGLNTRQDRVLQIGLIAASGDAGDGTEFLVNPGTAIPPQSTAIHGITAEDVAEAPPFPLVFSACRDRLSNRVLIGYNIGFDLAILSAETDRHGMEWRWGQALCLRQLATIALGRDAMLMMGDLDSLAAHYSIDTGRRHSALGDAVISLALYQSLLADLREKSIITLGDAKRAVAQLDGERMATARAGWVDVASPKDEALGNMPLARIDPFPYRHRISEIMMTEPLIRPRNTTLLEAAKTLSAHRADCLFVGTGPEAIEG